ncbi:unnamed protein product [Durusdinium trenchii]|uniref:Uncharacterized protein n=1 Tax=Durusdinium trenchii TaxID=1381693 RepID=A0ABP0NYB5_9DINO
MLLKPGTCSTCETHHLAVQTRATLLDKLAEVLPQTVHHTLSQFGQEISRRLVAFNEELASGEGWMINDVFGYHRRKQEAY